MGVGYYGRSTQWSKGEYANANNTQDDVALIAAAGAAPGRRGRRHQRRPQASLPAASATRRDARATSTSTSWAPAGQGGGNAQREPRTENSPNLDIALALLNSSGEPWWPRARSVRRLSSARTVASGLAASRSRRAVAGGTSYVRVDGTGAGNPLNTGYNDYASVGSYTLSVSGGVCTAGPAHPRPR